MRVIKNLDISGFQLQKEIVAICSQFLGEGIERRKKIKTLYEWKNLRKKYLTVIKDVFPKVIFERKNPLKTKLVSRHRFKNFRIENFLFESLPGWQVNATVYLPREEGIYPAVVCPTGHSSKTLLNYQRSAQIFARNGYIAVSFDPPGVSGELAYLNDHFIQGFVSYLIGVSSQSYFVVDALRCLDYLETRSDVDKKAGFAMTGVSGGGSTTYFSAMFDEQIKFFAPVCSFVKHNILHLKNLYSSCPEQFGTGYIKAGIDIEDYLSISAPKPCLLVAGKFDEVFDYHWAIQTYQEVKKIYRLFDKEENVNLFIDEAAGHAYTVRMANEVVKYMNKYIKKSSELPLPLTEDDIELVNPELLKCHPSNKVNMFTITKERSKQLKRLRKWTENRTESEKILKNGIKQLLGLSRGKFKPYKVIEERNPQIIWYHTLQKIDIKLNQYHHIPGLLFRRCRNKLFNKRPALLFIDENGKWECFKHYGFLSKAGRFLEEKDSSAEPVILSIDISGLGELSPQPANYDLASWNDIERILSYLSISAEKPIMGLRVMDTLCALSYLKSRSDVDFSKIVIGSKGIGATVSLLTALFDKDIKRIICVDMLSHYGALTEKPTFCWKESILIPGILKLCDIPDIINILSDRDIQIINPLDALKEPVPFKKAEELYPAKVLRDKDERNHKRFIFG